MTAMIECFEKWALEDRKVVATLRRGLTFDPGKYPSAYPYVEPFLNGEDSNHRREVFYLVASLWASHWKKGISSKKVSIAEACKVYMIKSESSSIEKRFISVLDADLSQLSYYLRQLITILKDFPIDFKMLLDDLLYWGNEQKKSQNKWARDFYRFRQDESQKTKEIIQ